MPVAYPITYLRHLARHRPAEFWQDLEHIADRSGFHWLLDPRQLAELCRRHLPSQPDTPYAPPASPVPGTDPAAWPRLVRMLARFRRAGDRGIGDVVHRWATRAGGNYMARAYTRLTGKDCGCGDRRQRLNRLYPFTPPDARTSG